MSKAVLVIDMPPSCDVCDFTDMANGKIYCGVPGCGKNTADYIACRPDWCPLVPVLENEAIEILMTENCYECSYGSESAMTCGNKNCEVSKAIKLAINALREVQQYRAIGTMEELKTMKENGAFSGAELAQICAMQMELKKYQSIGTVEECKAAVMNFAVAVLAEVAECAKQEDPPVYEGDKEIDLWVRLSDVNDAINKHLN